MENRARWRLDVGIAVAIGLTSATLCWAFLHRFQLGAADFNWAYDAARYLVRGENPYRHTPQGAIPYPLPAALLALPFAALSRELAGALFFGASSALLAFGLSRDNRQRLAIFLAYPYWSALMNAQWAPLLMCAAFFPIVSGVWIVKPNIALPVAVTYPSRKGLAAACGLLLASLIWLPRWPWEWLRQLGGYQHFFPLLVLPGPLLLVAAWRYRDRDARMLLFQSIMPQRWFYDCFLLWLIPKTRRQAVITVGLSWVIGIWRWYVPARTMQQVGLWCVLWFYLPMLGVVLYRTVTEAGAGSAKGRESSHSSQNDSTAKPQKTLQ